MRVLPNEGSVGLNLNEGAQSVQKNAKQWKTKKYGTSRRSVGTDIKGVQLNPKILRF